MMMEAARFSGTTISTGLHGAASQKTDMFILVAVRT
jgi:hypothetical protein